ncbi:hypothetical protein IMG5_009380 [Ichthyophthirius multifiliis]|uniref:ATPase AAA-type core domain-containing protein n=1 Tax=Ichthyophthirius multifiliis TaxID=5932 RepID=G0QJV1_ICHMU|nr:hypothetical protein IMG5_009380 [Ichthyophthirius multifiliis]EGR34502.1 hypothetical protein IMG5_009380 [Ichthyophthirius multifiliis]|eukprot:XP_004039806.1 hypothetical protein IMG5_009380 [Ichthyophthirius multifiliis]
MKENKNRNPKDMLAELIDCGIVKNFEKCRMDELIGAPNYLRIKQEEKQELQPDPSMFDIRTFLTENIVIPLGTPYIKENIEKMNYFHFFGPHGSGKTMAVRAIQTETDSIIIDLSPSSWEKLDPNKYYDKNGISRILYMSFEVARKYQPAIIYIDEVESGCGYYLDYLALELCEKNAQKIC